MALYAVENVGDAIEATKAFLFPIDRSRWLRLALVVLFVGGGFGMQFPANVGSSSSDFVQVDTDSFEGDIQPGAVPPNLPESISPGSFWLLVGAIVLGAVLLSLLLGFIGTVMEFVFVDSLRRDAVRIRQYFRTHWRAGLRLFGFRLGVTLLGFAVVAAIGVVIAGVVFGGIPTAPAPGQLLVTVVLLLPVMLVVFALVSLVNGFTTAFVVPVMLAEDRSVLGGWRRFWPTLRGHLKQYGAYVLMAFVLALGIGIITATAMGVGAVALLIPFALVGGLIFITAGAELSLAVGAVLALLALVYLALVTVLLALVLVPLQTFLRLYSLLILGDTNEELDVIADLRAEVRA